MVSGVLLVVIAMVGGAERGAAEPSIVVRVDVATASNQSSSCVQEPGSQVCTRTYSGTGLTLNGLDGWTVSFAITSACPTGFYPRCSFRETQWRLDSITKPGTYLAGSILPLYSNCSFSDYLAMWVTEGGGVYAGYTDAYPSDRLQQRQDFYPACSVIAATGLPISYSLAPDSYSGNLHFTLVPAG